MKFQRFKNDRWGRRVFGVVVAFCLFGATRDLAQDIFGVISGSVTDSSGAAIAGAKVTIQNEETKQTRVVVSNGIGFYTAPQLPVGHYSVVAEKSGFKRYEVSGSELNAGAHATIDLSLPVGGAEETISVSSVGQTVNTESAEIARTVTQQQVQALALNERNYVQLTTIIPGAATLVFDQTSLTTGQSTAAAAINGLRTDQNLFTVDGGYNLDSGSNSTQLNNVGIDFVQEVSVQTSNFSAEYGRNAGASVNVVTRSGGNQFHGGVFEFLRNNYADAISPGSKINLTSTTNIKNLLPPLRYNDFGWDVGGPILKDKLFFFAGQEYKKLRLPANAQNLTVPTTAELAGDFSDILDRTSANSLAATTLHVPANAPPGCTVVNNVFSAACITADGKAIANVYALAEARAAVFNNTPTTSNATFQPSTPQNFREDIIRVDYHLSPKHSLYYRYLHDDLNLIDPFGTFTPGGLPTTPTTRVRPGYSHQAGYIWNVSSKLINEGKFNVSYNKQRIPPQGNTWERETYGFQFPLPFPNAGTYPNGIPHVSFNQTTVTPPVTSDNPNPKPYTIANSGVTQFSGPFFSLFAPTTDITPSDTVTWQHGAHVMKFGALFARNRKDQNSRPDSYNGRITFQTSGNPNTTGDPFADALTGNFSTFAQQSADPTGHFRFNNVSLFVVDNWKVSKKFSLELGLRFEYTTPTYTQGNNIVNFDPSRYSAAAAPTAISAANVPTGGNLDQGYVVTGLVRPGEVPADQVSRVPGATSSFVTSVPATAPRGLFPAQGLVGPRVGIVYSLDDKTVIRAGYGIFYDKPEGNIVFGQPAIVPFLQAASFTNANLASPSAGTAGVPTIFGPSSVQPDLKVASNDQYSLSIQREARFGVLLEAAYVGNVGRHLLRQPNINAPTFASVIANPGKAANQIRPYFGYTDIAQFRSDSISDYNGLQLSATKRRGNLALTVNYTWSKSLATSSGETDNPEPECPFTCTRADGSIVSWNRFDYGVTSFDRRNIFSATYTYNLPFFKGSRTLLGEAAGGWSLSGITRAQSGQLLTVNSTTSIGTATGNVSYNRRANLVAGVPLTSGFSCPALKRCAFNPAAFAAPSTTSFGSAPIGNIIGPGYFATDLSLRKYFSMWRESNLLIQLDAFNAFNRANYSNPNTTIGGSLGTITASNPPRQLQLGAKINF